MSGTPKNFALAGAVGFVAARQLKAIKDTGHGLVAAVDPHDAVGILDQYSFDVRFFTEIRREPIKLPTSQVHPFVRREV